jgi:hypothetical protein
MSETTALARVEDYSIVTMAHDELREIVSENIGEGGLSVHDLDRVTVPAGGVTTWTIPGVEGEREEKAIEGIIVYKKPRRQMWLKKMEDGGAGRPNCVGRQILVGLSTVWKGFGIQVDKDDPTTGGRDGDGNLGPYDCDTCPHNLFGSGPGGRGKKCKNEMDLFVLLPDAVLPIVVKCSPASLKKLDEYMKGLTKRRLAYWGVTTRISLNRVAADKNTGRPAYSEIVFELVEPVPAEHKPRLKQYIDAIRPLLEADNAQKSEVDEEEAFA